MVDTAQVLSAGGIISALVGVIVYQNKKIEALYDQKDLLQDQRRTDMVAVNDKQNEILNKFSQTSELLLAKLEGKESK